MGVIVVVAVLAVGFRNQIFEQLVTKTAAKRMKENFLADLPDGLHVDCAVPGSPLPDPKREPPWYDSRLPANGCLIDAGSGAERNIVKLGFNPGDIEAVFLTHFHSDHIDGLGELMLMHWGGRPTTKPLPIYGAAGVSLIVNGLNQVYSQDMTYRVAHHGIEAMAPGGFGGEARVFETPSKEGRTVLLDRTGSANRCLRRYACADSSGRWLPDSLQGSHDGHQRRYRQIFHQYSAKPGRRSTGA